ncbi:type IV pilus modification protein PilV [Legionella oakridgensis]|uniref:Type IV pilus modification protein PilV n=2 Tax=Legionella oakridgensis TaxID=29423 RepID=W0BGX8_9GAMM|nr:type IV pilus modification protein PilV [Legionella oakridgensis]AHE67679.1 type IV pilus modification protein PilV [Legionella oakridgensis ATCC 33761 = DSM 21215]ETO92774.1 type IV pilus modification protein PilV [Legionella oakridgensis RV-2-2007]KTD36987.1 pre-pilin leader sequence (pilV) [Legionella oakridgensis]STY20704.1 pre-pilin leader sequence (pilV) [Legionella longbeachae]
MDKDVSAQCQKGFTLIEVLISVVILAIGLLGIAAIQLNMIRYNHSAQMRSIAIAQANNMIDRMRANYTGVKTGLYNNVSGIPANPGCTTCNSSQIAQLDTYQWNSNNALLLPSGQGTVINNGNHYTITLYWDNNRTGATGLNCSGNSQVDLTCLIMEVQL